MAQLNGGWRKLRGAIGLHAKTAKEKAFANFVPFASFAI